MSTVQRILRINVSVTPETFELPAGPILHVAPERFPGGPGRLEVWVEATTDEDFPRGDIHGEQTILVLPTGGEVPAGAKHRASLFDGDLVWHLYVLDCLCTIEETPGTSRVDHFVNAACWFHGEEEAAS